MWHGDETPKYYFFGPQLTDALSHIFRQPLTVVATPKGYGAEIAVRGYMARTNTVTLWVNIPKGADGDCFWPALCGALSGAGVNLDFTPKRTFPVGTEETIAFVRVFRRLTDNFAERKVSLVITDIQNSADMDDIYNFFRDIAAHYTSGLHIVLISSSHLPIRTDDLLVGTVGLLQKTLFLVARDGVKRMFDSYNIALSESELDAVVDFGEGWMSAYSALVIVALERRTIGKDTIAETRRRMTAYIRDSFWKDLSDDEQMLLSVMSYADKFTPDDVKRACALCGAKPGTKEAFELLARRLLPADYDEAGKTYHPHSLLRELAAEERRELPSAIRERLARVRGETSLDAALPNGADIAQLTPREWEVLSLLREGKKNHEIGESLYISENTVKAALKSIYFKLGVHSRNELMI
jgi:ATP/maltotriose-dependent transcriptional regulator MalT